MADARQQINRGARRVLSSARNRRESRVRAAAVQGEISQADARQQINFGARRLTRTVLRESQLRAAVVQGLITPAERRAIMARRGRVLSSARNRRESRVRAAAVQGEISQAEYAALRNQS